MNELNFASLEEANAYYETQVLGAIEKALDNYGLTMKMVVFYQLEKEYEIKRDQIHTNMTSFVKMIDALVGFGAQNIHLAILRELGASTGIHDLDKYDLVSAMLEFHHAIQRQV